MEKIKSHVITLSGTTSQGLPVKLRPMTENDWPFLEKWNTDPEVLYYSDGDDVSSYSPETVRQIYRGVCANAFCFIIEADGKPVGECWLQHMNLDSILEKHPDEDCRRIDLMIGQKDVWGKGIGYTVVQLLTEFGFVHQKSDKIFACHIADYNLGSLRVFKKTGYVEYSKEKADEGRKYEYQYSLSLDRESYNNRNST